MISGTATARSAPRDSPLPPNTLPTNEQTRSAPKPPPTPGSASQPPLARQSSFPRHIPHIHTTPQHLLATSRYSTKPSTQCQSRSAAMSRPCSRVTRQSTGVSFLVKVIRADVSRPVSSAEGHGQRPERRGCPFSIMLAVSPDDIPVVLCNVSVQGNGNEYSMWMLPVDVPRGCLPSRPELAALCLIAVLTSAS